MALLEVESVVRSYGGVRAVDDVSVQIDAGEWVAVIGPNGAGKSTLFNLLGGQVKPNSGTVRLAGRNINRLEPHARYGLGVARSFQISSLFPDLTVREHLTLACREKHRWNLARTWRGDRELQARVDEMLDLWGLDRDRDHALPALLSYGEQRRLELALAVASKPRLLLLDEPNVGLTAAECDDLLARLRALGPDPAVVFVAHDMDMVLGWATRILVMHQGGLLADGPPEEIANNPFVEEVYLGATGTTTA
ncbi:ABC transporter ATP-binding protein [Ornithinimicrobium ciconiae]|uniref:ABC transporter ATP-binding protein n=1 Tax=Ornithinimicrobium ciconiae TaxID=2594265 RepID=A0A516G938_9MICO|nr:ABC transporter ATP-binding protein [Ornithinimicrobium ciconiae]QDO88005.1 ABC transporter ATP-binding protein [Ornithinimicrobium ciconiae]